MHLTLHLTKTCNFRCDYCYAAPVISEPMSRAVAKAAMQLGASRNRGSCGIVFFGGEPLLYKDLIQDVVKEGQGMQQRGEGKYHFKITTNGMLLDDAFLDFTVRHDVLVAMSFDGIRAAHDAHRRLPDGSGTFDLLLPKLQLLLKARPYSSILMTVNPDTVHCMAESVSFLLDMGVRYILLSLNYAGQWDEGHLEELGRQYQRLGRLYIRWTRSGRKFYLSPFEVKLSSHINRHCFDHERCDFGARQLSVDPEGYLYPCVQFPKAGPQSRWCVGNVFDGVNETRLAELNQEARQSKRDCASCELNSRCAHTCACLNWQTTGGIHEASVILCRHERILTPIVDRVGNVLYRRRDPLFIQKHYNSAYPLLSLVEDAAALPS